MASNALESSFGFDFDGVDLDGDVNLMSTRCFGDLGIEAN